MSDPLSDPLAQDAVPVVNVAVTPLVASSPGISVPLKIRSCPCRSVNVEFEKSMLEIGPLVEAAWAGAAERYEFEAIYTVDKSPTIAAIETRTLRFLRTLWEVKNELACIICTKVNHTSAPCT